MPVTEDQRALLRLLIDGSNYTEIAELLGVGESEVRARAAKAVEDVQGEGAESDLAAAAKTRIGQLAGTEPAPVPPPAVARGPQRFGPATWLLIGGAIALVVILIVVLSSGGSDQSQSTSSQSAQEDVVTINMTPVGGSNAHGTVRIVRVADRPAVDLEIGGLRPSRPGETYVLSLVDSSSGKALPVAFRQVGPDGRFTGRSEIADAASGLLPDFDTAEIALAQDREAAATVQQAAQNATLPTRIGTPVLRGNLPHA
jgi:hypothetical protein